MLDAREKAVAEDGRRDNGGAHQPELLPLYLEFKQADAFHPDRFTA